MIDLLIEDVKVLIKGAGLIDADVGIDDGRISCICKGASTPFHERRIEGEGLLAVPGGIDPHAHMYDPRFKYREDYGSGSRSAILGGITTVIDMPLVVDVDDRRKVEGRIAEGERNSLIDFSLHAGFIRAVNSGMMGEVCEVGVCSFKVFLCPPYEIEEEVLPSVFERAKALGGILVFHAEDGGIVKHLTEKFSTRRDPLAVHEARPPESEVAAIYRLGFYARNYGTMIHIAHQSSRMGVEGVMRLRDMGVDVSVETCPQYLVFTRKDVERLGTYLKMAPSLKGDEDREYLWRALEEGVIDMVATDHAPGTREEKETEVWSAWGGVPGVATMLPLLYTYGVKRGLLSLERFMAVTSTNAARRFGLEGKGTLAPGYDADITLLDVKHERVVDGSELYKVGWSPYDGMALLGWPKFVISRGEILARDGEVLVKGGRGRFLSVRPHQLMSAKPSNLRASSNPSA